MAPQSQPAFRRLSCLFASLCLAGCAGAQLTVPLIPQLGMPGASAVWAESFDASDLSHWHEKSMHGNTVYRLVDLEGRRCLEADSRNAASILLREAQVDPDDHEWLSWEWRVDRMVTAEDLRRKDGSDASARVYVYFDTGRMPWQKRSLDYVWSSTLPVGTMLPSAYSNDSKIIVVQSGAEGVGRWHRIERNLEDDYRAAFGDDPPDMVAVGLSTDTDNTGSEALAYYDSLQITRQRAP